MTTTRALPRPARSACDERPKIRAGTEGDGQDVAQGHRTLAAERTEKDAEIESLRAQHAAALATRTRHE